MVHDPWKVIGQRVADAFQGPNVTRAGDAARVAQEAAQRRRERPALEAYRNEMMARATLPPGHPYRNAAIAQNMVPRPKPKL